MYWGSIIAASESQVAKTTLESQLKEQTEVDPSIVPKSLVE